ncbi:MAG: tetratricopeptide repeat protein [Alphaproteobacteria bacterium]|nr:tetratricopeptide repeat protein [Alphaproteobacteria bacterium]
MLRCLSNHPACQKITALLLLGMLAACAPEQPGNTTADGMSRIGDQLRARGDDAGAVDFYLRGLQRAPQDVQARKALGAILEKHGDNANAVEQYREGLKYAPDDADLLRSYGRVLIRLNQPAEARDAYAHALKSDSRDIKSLNGLGVSLDMLGQHDAAQKTYKEALDSKHDDLPTLNNLAHSYVLSGAYGEAIKLLEPHARNREATPALRQNLAEAYGMAGMEADAERMARMDLTSEQVKRNLAFYRKARARLTPGASLYADLGDFATQAIADANLEQIKTTYGKELEGLTLAVVPEIKSIGSTPRFVVRATGFAKSAQMRAFCDRLQKDKALCVPHAAP